MSLKLRRGTNTQRTSITPAEGELIYVTDTKKLYVGDGITAGGIAVDTNGSGITDIVQDTTPQLGGDLDANGHYFVSSADIRLAPNARVVVGSPIKGVDGNLIVVRESYSVALDAGISYFQHHETVDAVNLNLIRTRGTNSIPTTVLPNDDLGEINFVGHTGTTYVSAVQIAAQVDGSPTSSQIPSRLIFQVNNGVSRTTKAELNSSGVWKTDSVQALTTNANLTLSSNGTGQIILDGMTWPSTDGLNGQVLATNGAGSLSWITVSSGGSTFSRTTVVGSSSSLADGSSENVDITGASKGYLLYKIQTNEPARVRIYTDQASRTADESRAEGFPSTAGNGLIAEIITTTSNQVYTLSPGVIGFNNESTPTTSIFLRVTNKGGYTTPINTTLTILNLET